jgi:uncharacterized protein
MNTSLKTYLNHQIIPIYDGFDSAHQSDHVKKVIFVSLEIAKDYEVNTDMVYTIACYHDIGMQFGRDQHHLTGGLFLYKDLELKTYFDEKQIIIMKEAVEDHRASNDDEPRTIYGKIIAEADRDIDIEIVCTRTVQFGFKHYPHLSVDEHIDRAYAHIVDKYGPDGYLKLWLHTKHNQKGLKEIHKKLKNEDEMKAYIKNIYINIKKT